MILLLGKLILAARLATAIVTTWPEIDHARATSAAVAIVAELVKFRRGA